MKLKLIFLMVLVGTLIIHAQDSKIPKVGDRINAFSAIDDNGDNWNLSDVSTDYLVVYFYPAAMTGGCTKQACAYRDDKSKLDALNATIIGVSGDKAQNLAYFKDAYDLNFSLLSDNSGEISELFGVPVREGGAITREISGKEQILERSITTARWTFILDRKGTIIYKNASVKASEDSSVVRKAIQDHKKSR